MVNHGSEGVLNLLWPADGNAESARMAVNQTLSVPSDPALVLRPDRAGQERVKAFLFTDVNQAKAFLAALNLKPGASPTYDAAVGVMSRSVVADLAGERLPLVTADLSFYVTSR